MARTTHPKLGQHFLADLHYRRRIADALPLAPSDVVIEIGPGRGAMTELLAERAGRVVAIELDRALARELETKLAPHPRISILAADVLAVDLSSLCRPAETCFVFGNLPYYITSPIIHHAFQFRRAIRGMAFVVQREVAARLTARPASRDYGYLSVFVQLFSQPRIVFGISAGAFSPPPKVQSALVTFSMAPLFPPWTPHQEEQFLEFVKLCFAKKRKNLVNNLAGFYSRQPVIEALEQMRLASSARAEELAVAQLAELFEHLTRL